MEIELYSYDYLDDRSNATDWNVYPSSNLYAELMRRFVESKRWIARIGDVDIVQVSCAVGDPLEYTTRDRIYAPQWILDSLGLEGAGEMVQIEWVRCEDLPAATKLVLRPSEEMMAEPRELLEGPLSLLGAVRAGSVLPLPGGFGTLTVELTEPADEVFLDGAEIAVDFMTDHLAPAVPEEPVAAPAVPLQAAEEPVKDAGMLPETFALAALAAQREARARENRRRGLPSSFEAFSGQGYSMRGTA